MDHNPKVIRALMAVPELKSLSLEECFGGMMELSAETLRDLPGVPQQVMLAQTLYFLKSRTPIREELLKTYTTLEDVLRVIKVAEAQVNV